MEFFEISEKTEKAAAKAEENLSARFKEIESVADYNGRKVLAAFINNRISEACLCGSTGYGYSDMGRDAADAVVAQIFGAEDALLRHNFVSGTHALSVALFGVLRPNDRLVSVTGAPYDTLEEVIGIRDSGEMNGSLRDFGVKYGQVDLLDGGVPDYEKIAEEAKTARVIYIQRSRGYSLRPAMCIDVIEKISAAAKAANPEVIVMVDNCYGEFVEKKEPTQVGADIAIGSLIKNMGGGIAKTGGYIVGRKDLVEKCAYRLTCVGMGKEVGCTLGETREMLLGLFLAPQTVMSAVKVADFAAELFRILGFEAFPQTNEVRSDIITVLKLGNEERLCAFCRAIQAASPVDSFVTPEPWDMPGYDSKVIMAAGAFTGGASIELSADAPIREPFAAWLQGGLTYPTGKLGIMLAADKM